MGKYEFIKSFCLSQKGTVEDYKEEWQATRYLVGGKMYAMRGGDGQGNPIITVKLPPEEGLALRDMYAGDILPGYYMNKEHWNSVYFLAASRMRCLGKCCKPHIKPFSARCPKSAGRNFRKRGKSMNHVEKP